MARKGAKRKKEKSTERRAPSYGEQALAERSMRSPPGVEAVVAVAGHSNTIPALAHAFGVLLPDLEAVELDPPIPHGYLPHGAYDRVHVLTPGQDGARLLEMRYGAPS